VSENSLKSDPPKRTCGPSQTEIQEIELLQHAVLAPYWPSERRAIVVHKFYLSIEKRSEASIEEAVKSWETGVGTPWRRAKMRRDGLAQFREIERHKFLVSQTVGRDIGWEVAAKDWVEKHAAAWRAWWETQPESGA
jgi:hypothetical protein